jgi:hypothetical protein
VVYAAGDRPETIAQRLVDAITAAVSGGSLAGVTAAQLSPSLVQIAGAARLSLGAGLSVVGTAPVTLEIPGDPGAQDEALITDGGSFAVRRGTTTVAFTFDGPGGSSAPAPAIVYYPKETPEILVRRVVAAINAQAQAGTLTGVTACSRSRGPMP